MRIAVSSKALNILVGRISRLSDAWSYLETDLRLLTHYVKQVRAGVIMSKPTFATNGKFHVINFVVQGPKCAIYLFDHIQKAMELQVWHPTHLGQEEDLSDRTSDGPS